MEKKKKKGKATFLKSFKLHHANHVTKPSDGEAKAGQGDTLPHLVDLLHFSVSTTQPYSNQQSTTGGKAKACVTSKASITCTTKACCIIYVRCDIPILPLRMY